MTVIAVRDGVMAADTAFWQGSIIAGRAKKIVRLPDGRLFALSGPRAIAEACEAWLRGGGQPTSGGEAFGGLILAGDGVWCVDDKFRLYHWACQWAAEGAHTEFLLGAMAAGASAEEAVRLAIQFGDGAGGEVQVERF